MSFSCCFKTVGEVLENLPAAEWCRQMQYVYAYWNANNGAPVIAPVRPRPLLRPSWRPLWRPLGRQHLTRVDMDAEIPRFEAPGITGQSYLAQRLLQVWSVTGNSSGNLQFWQML